MQSAHFTWIVCDGKWRNVNVFAMKQLLSKSCTHKKGELHLYGKEGGPAVGHLVFQHSTTHRLLKGIHPYTGHTHFATTIALSGQGHTYSFGVWPLPAEAKFASKFSKVELLALLQSFSFPHISTHNKVHIKTQSYLQFDSRDAFYFDSIGWEECIEFL